MSRGVAEERVQILESTDKLTRARLAELREASQAKRRVETAAVRPQEPARDLTSSQAAARFSARTQRST